MTFPLTKPDQAELARLQRGELPDDNMWWSWWGDFMNFGDWIGPWLYHRRTGRYPRHCAPGHVPEGVAVHFTCGSILQKIRKKNRAVVWGTGIKNPDDYFMRPKQVLAVRGPLTRRVLEQRRYEQPEVMGDPGLCLPLYHAPQTDGRKFRLGLIPHVYDLGFWRKNKSLLPEDTVLIDLKRPIEEVIDLIRSCEGTLSTSLHGIIVSHAYGIPTAWIGSFSKELESDFKFRDYFQSVGMDLTGKDRRKIALPFDPGDYAADLALPPKDLKAMARELLAVCPF